MPSAPPSLPMIVPLPGGDELVVRRLHPDDADAIVHLYAGLGARDRHRRFFSQFPARRDWVVTWIERCLGEGDGIVAVAPDGRIVGESAYVVQENGDGEFSLTVDGDWRGWLGPFLLDVLVELAASHGVPNLEADILTENAPMRALARRRNAVVSGESDAAVQHVVIGTTGRQAVWPPHGSGRRVLVEAPGGRWSAGPAVSRAGFDVLGCAGPGRRSVVECPMRQGRPCPLAAGADVIVVAVAPDTEAGAWLLEAHARLHPDVPVLVIGPSVDAEASGDTSACRLAAGAPAAAVVEALERLAGPARAGDQAGTDDTAPRDLRPSRRRRRP